MPKTNRARWLSFTFDIAELQMLSLGMISAVEAWNSHEVAVELQEDINEALKLAIARGDDDRKDNSADSSD